MTSVTSPQQTGRSGADIPGPRGGQSVRLLVLGSDSDAQKLRDQAVAAGYELAQRYSVRVSHVAYGSGVDPEDARYSRIRDAGLPIVPIQACACELGLEAAGGNGDMATHEKAAVENEPEAGVRSSASIGESLGTVAIGGFAADELEFPPFEQLAGPASGLVPGFDVDFGAEVGEADADAEGDASTATGADVGVSVGVGVRETVVGVRAAVATDIADEDDEDAEEDTDELPLGAAVIGADPWLGHAADSDITGYIPQITATTVVEVDVPPAAAEAEADVDAFADAPPPPAATPAKRLSTRRLLLSLGWALVPFASFGLLTPVVFGYAAYRLRSRTLAIAALGYTLAVVLSFALSAARPPAGTPGNGSGTLLTFALAVMWIGGTVHALSLRTRVFVA